MNLGWHKLALVLLISVSLIGAPCGNCQSPNPEPLKTSAHDCCPKPQPEPTKSCQWQPSDKAATVDGKTSVEAPAVLESVAAVAPQFETIVRSESRFVHAAPAPLYLQQHVLLI